MKVETAAVGVGQRPAVPWYLWCSALAVTSAYIGGYWDISWHMSIGRDTLWSPPHMVVYLGATVAGLAASWVVLRTTFAGTDAERAEGVRVLGFRGPTGAFFCCWGAGAMLTSAPFDDWWHNAYGLDVRIISPPHAVLGIGMVAVQLGAMLIAAALNARARGDAKRMGLEEPVTPPVCPGTGA